MKEGSAASSEAGMPLSHAQAFQKVANLKDTVICSRAVGKMATQLLEEGYATKGYHDKAKSCPWGPMAGFVLADPRFTKNPDIEGQRRDLIKARDYQDHSSHGPSVNRERATAAGESETPLYISDARRAYLESIGYISQIEQFGRDEILYNASRQPGSKVSTGSMYFVLRRATGVPGQGSADLWSVNYGRTESRLSNDLLARNKYSTRVGLLPVMAVVDPLLKEPVRGTYRAATTGDYDLFAIFPPAKGKGAFNRKGADKRMVAGSDRFRIGLSGYIGSEDEHLGNMTPRLFDIRSALNNAVMAAGYTGGDVVHHSDEAGRPLVNSVDYPFIAFIPGKTDAVLAENVSDFKKLISMVFRNYVISFNPGWQRSLGFSVSSGGSYEV